MSEQIDYKKEAMDKWTKEATDRTGITLAKAKAIAKAHNGHLPKYGYETCVYEFTVYPHDLGTRMIRVWLSNTSGYFHLKIL